MIVFVTNCGTSRSFRAYHPKSLGESNLEVWWKRSLSPAWFLDVKGARRCEKCIDFKKKSKIQSDMGRNSLSTSHPPSVLLRHQLAW